VQTSDEGQAPVAAGTTPMSPEIPAESSMEPEAPPADEQLRLLVIGFATGLTIGGVFLIYIVLSTAKLL
jgi:hypothetical protein